MVQNPSIRQNPNLTALPDFGSSGIWLRVVLVAHLCGLLGVLLHNHDSALLLRETGILLAHLEPTLLLSLVLFYLLRRILRSMPYWYSTSLMLIATASFAALVEFIFAETQHQPLAWGGYLRIMAYTVATCAVLLGYFFYRHRMSAPAFSDARLMALTARIRPHFLFNSLNAVLGVIRSDPRRAEAALEELAELFRALMRENRELTPLSEEIALARQYLGLERLRLGERLQVVWDVESCPPDTLVPPLMLQPLLENAVYHGIEPNPLPGTVTVRLGRHGNRVRIELSNPTLADSGHARGSRMALANIRERLELFFGADAVMAAGARAGNYHVLIDIPFFRKVGA